MSRPYRLILSTLGRPHLPRIYEERVWLSKRQRSAERRLTDYVVVEGDAMVRTRANRPRHRCNLYYDEPQGARELRSSDVPTPTTATMGSSTSLLQSLISTSPENLPSNHRSPTLNDTQNRLQTGHPSTPYVNAIGSSENSSMRHRQDKRSASHAVHYISPAAAPVLRGGLFTNIISCLISCILAVWARKLRPHDSARGEKLL